MDQDIEKYRIRAKKINIIGRLLKSRNSLRRVHRKVTLFVGFVGERKDLS